MSLAAEQTVERTGLEQLKALIAGERRPGIVETLDFEFVEVEEGLAVFEGVPGLAAYNPIGTVHGGYAATLLDSAMGCAVHTRMKAGQGYTTLELSIAYHRALKDTSGPVRAEGRVISLGRRAAFAEGKLFDKDGALCATSTTTCLVYSQ